MIILCGPTAVGKTAAAVELAHQIDAEIISADSGQVYRGLDIGTAKPTLEEREGIPFHLIDLLNPDEQFSAAQFKRLAEEAIAGIVGRGRRVIVCGGTGLYLRALEKGLCEGPARDPAVRAELEKRAADEGIESLHRELQKVDAEAARLIPSRNRQRIIRALEVYRLTGRPISEWWNEHCRGAVPAPGRGDLAPIFSKFGLTLLKEELHRRIERRVDQMIERGLVDEVAALLPQWGPEAPGFRLIGYKEIVKYLQDKVDKKEAISLIKKNTRQYAKRQTTWFKKDSEIQWIG